MRKRLRLDISYRVHFRDELDEDQAELWIRSIIEAFGPTRSVFGSHLPIDTLSYGFDRLYDAYERIVGGL